MADLPLFDAVHCHGVLRFRHIQRHPRKTGGKNYLQQPQQTDAVTHCAVFYLHDVCGNRCRCTCHIRISFPLGNDHLHKITNFKSACHGAYLLRRNHRLTISVQRRRHNHSAGS